MGTRARTDLPPRRTTTQLAEATDPGTKMPMLDCFVTTDPGARPGESYRRQWTRFRCGGGRVVAVRVLGRVGGGRSLGSCEAAT